MSFAGSGPSSLAAAARPQADTPPKFLALSSYQHLTSLSSPLSFGEPPRHSPHLPPSTLSFRLATAFPLVLPLLFSFLPRTDPFPPALALHSHSSRLSLRSFGPPDPCVHPWICPSPFSPPTNPLPTTPSRNTLATRYTLLHPFGHRRSGL